MADTFTPHLNLIKPDVVKDALISDINGNQDLIDAAVLAHENRLDFLDDATSNPASSSTVITPVAGWTITAQSFFKVGRFVFGYFRVQKATSALVSNASGNIANTTVGNVPAGWRPLTTAACPHNGEYGQHAALYLNSAGLLGVGALSPNINWDVGDEIAFSTVYIADI